MLSASLNKTFCSFLPLPLGSMMEIDLRLTMYRSSPLTTGLFWVLQSLKDNWAQEKRQERILALSHRKRILPRHWCWIYTTWGTGREEKTLNTLCSLILHLSAPQESPTTELHPAEVGSKPKPSLWMCSLVFSTSKKTNVTFLLASALCFSNWVGGGFRPNNLVHPVRINLKATFTTVEGNGAQRLKSLSDVLLVQAQSQAVDPLGFVFLVFFQLVDHDWFTNSHGTCYETYRMLN